jgi:hypothetical protein
MKTGKTSVSVRIGTSEVGVSVEYDFDCTYSHPDTGYPTLMEARLVGGRNWCGGLAIPIPMDAFANPEYSPSDMATISQSLVNRLRRRIQRELVGQARAAHRSEVLHEISEAEEQCCEPLGVGNRS